MTKVDNEDFENSNKCWICVNDYNDSNVKVSEYPFKQNKNILKNMRVLLYLYFCNISLNVLRPTFFNI